MSSKIYVLIKDTDQNILYTLKDELINSGFNRDCFDFMEDDDEYDSICIDCDNYEVTQIDNVSRKKNYYDLDNEHDLDLVLEAIRENLE